MSSNPIKTLQNLSQSALQDWIIRDPDTALAKILATIQLRGLLSLVNTPLAEQYERVWEQLLRAPADECRREAQRVAADHAPANAPAIFKCWSAFSRIIRNSVPVETLESVERDAIYNTLFKMSRRGRKVCMPFEIFKCNWRDIQEVCYFSEQLSSLKTAWPRMRDALTDAGVPANANIPDEQADLSTIRTWLQKRENAEPLNRVRKLDLSNLGLFTVPEELKYFTNLQMLNLSHNQLIKLPPNAFQELSQLRALFLDNNQLTELPQNVFQGVPQLEILHLSHNQLTKLLPDIFLGLSQLEALYLEWNQLTELPPNIFGGVSQLNILCLTENQLTQLPQNVFQGVPQLDSLYLDHNPLTELPSNIFGGLSRLERLYLDPNPIPNPGLLQLWGLNQLCSIL